MSDPIESLCTVLLDIAKTSPGANINDVMARVKSELDRNGELTNALQTDARMLQINLGQSKGYQVLVEGNATAYIGDRYEFDSEAVIKALGQLLDEIALSQSPVGTPQNLPRSGVVEFVGRDSKLKELHEQLQNNRRIAIAAVQGMGGIGKTELALQYAIAQFQQGGYSAGLCWLRARDREIATDIVNFAQVHLGLKLPEQLEIDAQVAFCWQRWPEGEVLVVLDDVTDYNAIEPYLPPADPRFKLLITTRLDLGSTVQKVAIEELDEDSAIALLESLVGGERIRSQLADAQALCRWVGYLPLALELLGRFLSRKPDWSIDRLLKALTEKRLAAKALIAPESGMTGQLGVAAALELSWQELNEAEQELACVLGMFAIAPIPWSLVASCQLEVEPDNLEDIRDDGLMARSLLKRIGEGSYQLHQIVREYFRIKLEQRVDRGQTIKVTFWQVMVVIAESIDELPTIDQIAQVRESVAQIEEGVRSWIDYITDEDLIKPFLGIRQFYQGQGSYSFAESWSISCLEIIQKRLGEGHSYVASSLNNLASIYYLQGRYKKAESLYVQALEKSSSLFRGDCPNIAGIMNNLSVVYSSQRRHDESEKLCILSLEMRKRILGEEHPDIAQSMNNLAQIYQFHGRYKDAEKLYASSLEICKNTLGEEHYYIAQCLNNLALLYCLQKRYQEAEPLNISALGMYKRLLGEEHPAVAQSLNNLALLYSSNGKYDGAEKLYRSSFEMRKRLLGDEHPDVAQSMNNLAELYRHCGRYEDAKYFCVLSLEMRKRLLGDEHPDVAESLNNLALLYYSEGKYEESEHLLRFSLEIYKKILGDEHPTILGSLNNLAEIYKIQRNYKNAELIYHSTLKMCKSLFGEEHPDIAQSMNNLAELYQSCGRYEEAEPLYLSLLNMLKRLHGDVHPWIASSMNNLAELYRIQQIYDNAEHLHQSALKIYKCLFGEEHPDIALSLNNLALLYSSKGEYSKAEPFYLSSLDMVKRLSGDEHPSVILSQLNLGVLYQKQGRYPEAKALYLQSLAISQSTLGSNHPHTQNILGWLNSLPQPPV